MDVGGYTMNKVKMKKLNKGKGKGEKSSKRLKGVQNAYFSVIFGDYVSRGKKLNAQYKLLKEKNTF